MKITPIKAILAAVFVAAVSITALNSWTIVQPGEAKLGTMFGKLQDTPLTEGFHIVNPLMSFKTTSIKDFTVTWDNVKVPAQDKLKSGMDLAVTLQFKTAAIPRMQREAGTLRDAFDKYVTPQVYSLLRECGKGVAQSQDFFKDEVQTEMQDFMLTNLRERLESKGFSVKMAVFSDISLPPLVQQAIEDTKKRQEKVNQERAQLEIVALEQQKVVKISESNRDASISNKAAKKNNSDAAAYDITVKAKAQADANTLLAESVSVELIDYIRANNWNGVRSATVLGANTTPLVSLK